MIAVIFKISENGKYITEESSPLSGKINHFLNPAYFENIGLLGTIILFIIFLTIIRIIQKK